MGQDGPEVRAVALAGVRERFAALYPIEGDDHGRRADAKHKAFGRAVAAATARDLIGSIELHGLDYVWLKPEAD